MRRTENAEEKRQVVKRNRRGDGNGIRRGEMREGHDRVQKEAIVNGGPSGNNE